MIVAILIGLPAPLAALHILWVNLITDSVPAIALGAGWKDPDLMKDKPRNPKESLFARGGYFVTVGYGALIALLSLTAFLIVAMEGGGDKYCWYACLLTQMAHSCMLKPMPLLF